MRKLLLFSLLLSSFSMHALSDTLKSNGTKMKRWNITASVGYGFPFSKHVLGSEATVDSNSTSRGKIIRGTYGKGIFCFVSAGYKINSHLGAELGIHSTVGSKLLVNQFNNLVFNSGSETFMQISTSGMFAGFFLTDTYSKFHISLHTDLLIGMLNRATEERFTGSIQYPTWEYSGRISYGWLSRFGGSYDISPKINIGLTGFFLMHSWSPAQKNTLNGQNKITFTDDILYNGFYPISTDQLSRVTFPLHAAGASIFISYNF